MFRSAFSGTGDLVWYGTAMAAVAFGYRAYGVWRNRDVRFLLFAFYGPIHLGLLVPVRIRALFTLTDDRWGRRGVSS